jgi:hypothetical protein
MDLDLLTAFIERLRLESIGDPRWIASKDVFEYSAQSVEVAAVLKLVRAGQGIHALVILCRCGLFVDMGAIYRCVEDCTSEVYFLLENYPKKSINVERFLKGFFSRTIEGHLTSQEESVQTKKIQSAMVRAITGRGQDERTRRLLANIHRTFSGYTHAEYAHIMQMFGGPPLNRSFNISGIPSQQQKDMHMEVVREGYKAVLLCVAHASRKLGLVQLSHDVRQYC